MSSGVKYGQYLNKYRNLPGEDHTSEGNQITSINAGATITAMQMVYLASDGEWAISDASAEATSTGMLSIALEAGTDGNPMKVALPGSFIKDETWAWTPGDILYASETAGEITATAPTGTTDAVVRIVGYAITADTIYFDPSPSYVVLS